jgi:membrane protein
VSPDGNRIDRRKLDDRSIDLTAAEREQDAERRDQGGDEHDRGRQARKPSDLPARGWKDVALRVKDEIKEDRVPLISAGVAFYAMLALFPALTAFISVYGLVADPEQVQQQIDEAAGFLEGGAGQLISEQAQAIAQAGGAALTTGFAVSLVAALWSASSGVHGLMQALTVANNEPETRGFVKRRALALGLTLAGILVLAIAIGVIVVLPVMMNQIGLGGAGELAVRILRWPLLAVVAMVAIATMYRYGPDRDKPQWRWVSWGAVLATVLWVLASIGFSVYVQNFGNYNETYGALGAVIVLLLWLFISAFIVVLGAEVNAEMEHQTATDTTVGDERPMGQRDAEVADHLGQQKG